MNIKDIDINKMTDAIEKDAGQKIEGLKESITEMKEGATHRVYNEEQLLIRKARLSTGLTQEGFAKLINTPVATLRDWEQGRYPSSGAVNCLMRLIISKPRIIDELVAA